MGYEIFLKKGEERRIAGGHPWVYANEVARIEGKDKNGSLATVRSFDGRFLGKGYLNHASKILVRIFIRGTEDDEIARREENEKALFRARIHAANAYRRSLGLTEAYRAVFAEADDLPALIVDKYGDYLSVQFLSLGVDRRKKTIAEVLVEEFAPKGIYERSDVAVRKKEGLEEVTGVLYGEVPDEIVFEENGLKMAVDVKNGQKTGYFLDQRENRLAVRRYAKGDVLDCFCNSGGFSMNCALTADHVLSLDASPRALESVRRNAALNGFHNVETVCGDAFELLRALHAEGRKFDLVILDPPAFCKSAAEVKDALKGYLDINLLGLKLVKEGGFLVSSSCSHFVTLPMFENMLKEAAARSHRRVQIAEMRAQAPDHPALLAADETMYLKFFVLHAE